MIGGFFFNSYALSQRIACVIHEKVYHLDHTVRCYITLSICVVSMNDKANATDVIDILKTRQVM